MHLVLFCPFSKGLQVPAEGGCAGMEDAGSGVRRAAGMRCDRGVRARGCPAPHPGTGRAQRDAPPRSPRRRCKELGAGQRHRGGLERHRGPQRLHNPRRAPPCRSRGAPRQPSRQPAALGEATDAAGQGWLLPSLSFFIFPPLPIPELPRGRAPAPELQGCCGRECQGCWTGCFLCSRGMRNPDSGKDSGAEGLSRRG